MSQAESTVKSDNHGDAELDVVVVGAGLIGLATAMALLEDRPRLRLAVVDKESQIAAHQSGHNSGVIHAGLYYAPGSIKARLCREGRRALIAFADAHEVPYTVCGKLVVAVDDEELPRLNVLRDRGLANGLTLRELAPEEIAELEPNVRGVRAIHVAESGVIDFRKVAACYATTIEEGGGSILLDRRVDEIERRSRGWRIRTNRGELKAGVIVTCGGLHSDRLARLTGAAVDGIGIVPFRGDYYTFRPYARDLVRGLVYPVPDPAFPFLGVHFTRRVDGELLAGPNAVPAFAREGYRRRSIDAGDMLELLRFPGLRRLARKYARTGAREIWRDLVKPAFVAEMRRYVPAVQSRDVVFGPSGVRAQAMQRDGALVEDFLITESENAVHVLNAPSPAATASIVIGQHVASLVGDRLAR